MANEDRLKAGREFLRATDWGDFSKLESDQQLGKPVPPLQKPAPDGATVIDLLPPADFTLGTMPFMEVLAKRRSRRKFLDEPLSLEQLSILLWATQGIQRLIRGTSIRPAPSGGARHPFETCLYIERVEGLAKGLYRYQPLEHQLVLLREGDLSEETNTALLGQRYNSAVVAFWTAIPYRTEWRYSIHAAKLIAQDSGHLAQNLYLAAEAIGCGACTIGAYDQKKSDDLLGVDGADEFTVYAAIVGRIKHKPLKD